MSTHTTNYGLIKPADGEQYDVEIINNNYDAIDALLFSKLGTAAPFGHAGKVDGFQTINGSDIAVTIDDQKLKGGMTFESSSGGRLVIPIAGQYEIRVKGYVSESSGYDWMAAAYKNSVKMPETEIFEFKETTSDYKDYSFATVDLAAGDRIGLGMTLPNRKTWGTNGYNGTFLEVKYVGVS